MANNWKILDGVNYIAKGGVTGANGTAGTLEAPRLLDTTAFGINGKTVIGSGGYRWPVGFALAVGPSQNVVGDGHTRILGDSTTIPQAFANSVSCDNLYLDQFAGITLGAGNGVINYARCIFDLTSQSYNNFQFTGPYQNSSSFTNCVFINCNAAAIAGGGYPINISSCLFINCLLNFTGNSYVSMYNCYLDGTTGIYIGNGVFGNCNIDPAIVSGTANRGVKVSSGAWSNGQSYAGATNMTTQAPQFNNAALRDFTLKAASPHVALGIGPGQYGIAVTHTIAYTGAGADVTPANTGLTSSLGGTVPLNSVSFDALQVNGLNGLVIKPVSGGNGYSTFLSGVLTLDPNGAKEMGIISPLAGFNMNSDFQTPDFFAPDIRNNNVVDYNNGVAAGGDRKPNRLSCRIRWSTLAAPDPTNAGHWVSGATLVEMEWFAKASYNLAGYVGNASLSFVPANSLPVLCRTYQIEITTRNNYGA